MLEAIVLYYYLIITTYDCKRILHDFLKDIYTIQCKSLLALNIYVDILYKKIVCNINIYVPIR